MLLSGLDLAEYIKERHYRQVRSLRFVPKLVAIHASSDASTDVYLKVKKSYATEIGVDFEVERVPASTTTILAVLERLNSDSNVHGVIVQLPLPESVDTDKIVDSINPKKDIDGLGSRSEYDSATPMGILWLLAGYNIDYKGKTVTVVGQGRLVGAPISKMLEGSGAKVVRCDINTTNLANETLKADILITATGQKNLVQPSMVKSGTVVIDVAGDADPDLLKDETLKITPARGGVGPMTVAALFDNLLRAAQKIQQ